MTDPTKPDPAGVSTALATREGREALTLTTSILTDEEIGRVWRLSQSLAASGMFKGKDSNALTETQAFAKILIGRDLGLSAAQSLMGLDIVRGALQVRGKQLLAWVRASESYDYEVVERTAERGALRFYARSKRTGEWEALDPVIAFTIEEAKAAGLVKPDGGWAKYPANMCLWRCASIGVNLLCPDLLGGTPVYTEADDLRGFAPRPGDGESSGEAPGWQGLSVKQAARAAKIVARAGGIGYAGLTSEAALQMEINHQAPHVIDAKLAEWEALLDGAAAATVGDATEVVDGPAVEADPLVGDPAELDARALALMGRAEAASAEGDVDAAGAFEEEASALHAEAEALRAGQTTLGGM